MGANDRQIHSARWCIVKVKCILMYLNDSDLIKACLAGKEAAWKNLVDRYARLVYSVAQSQGLHTDETEDIFQEVFTLTFRHLQNLRHHKLIAVWLITTTTRECQRVRQRMFQAEASDKTIPNSDDVQVWERRYAVHEAMQQLESSCRQVLEMFFREPPMTCANIADQLGVPVGSIGPMRAHCFKKLEAILTSMGTDLV